MRAVHAARIGAPFWEKLKGDDHVGFLDIAPGVKAFILRKTRKKPGAMVSRRVWIVEPGRDSMGSCVKSDDLHTALKEFAISARRHKKRVDK